MYKIKRVCICDHCGITAFPYKDMYGDLMPPRGWGTIKNKIHLCPQCYNAYLKFMEEGEKYDEQNT